ncbi:MAG: quinol:electron acceptor oxidoreductase subunit ActD [Gallionella sp.]
MSKRHLLALFSNFDTAELVVKELRNVKLKGFNADKDMIVKSPIEHPEVEEFLGDKPVYVQWYTLGGALAGGLLAFFLISGSQANFFSQLKGGKPIVPFPPNFVLTYEMFILGGVYISVLGFFICAGLPTRRSPLYSAKVSEDQIGILVQSEESASSTLKAIFTKHQALEIQEEAGK